MQTKKLLAVALLAIFLSMMVNEAFATTETRYFKNASVTVNGLSAYSLATDQSGTGTSQSKTQAGNYLGAKLGILVWKRGSGGNVTEITSGTQVAQITSVDGDFHQEYSNTWACPETSLASTDSIVIKVYYKFGALAWGQLGTCVFTTEQIGASKLDSATWTVYYITSFTYDVDLNRGSITFYWDGSDNSRITNFSYTTGGTAFVQVVSEKIVIPDSLYSFKAALVINSEKINIFDSIAKDITLVTSETVTILDSIITALGHNFVEIFDEQVTILDYISTEIIAEVIRPWAAFAVIAMVALMFFLMIMVWRRGN